MHWSLDDCISPKKKEYNLLSTEPELKHASGHETEQLDYWSPIRLRSGRRLPLAPLGFAQGTNQHISTLAHHQIICSQYLTQTSLSPFLFISGTKVSFSGYPTGINKKGFSFSGRFRIVFKKFIGLGVCVKATNPQ